MARQISKNASVAFCTPPLVDEPGLYVMEGEVQKTTHAITEGSGDGGFDENGRWNFGYTRNVDTHEVAHETEFKPGRRVYPYEGWFSYENPADEEGDES